MSSEYLLPCYQSTFHYYTTLYAKILQVLWRSGRSTKCEIRQLDHCTF